MEPNSWAATPLQAERTWSYVLKQVAASEVFSKKRRKTEEEEKREGVTCRLNLSCRITV